jgi:hypothetical protein
VRLEIMRGYAETQDCRRRYLLTYFGEEAETPCGFCDTCEAGLPAKTGDSPEPFPPRSWVVHRQWGKGLVIGAEGGHVTIMFEGEARRLWRCSMRCGRACWSGSAEGEQVHHGEPLARIDRGAQS